jgi:octaprenyl-diphosphate synthase
VRKAIEEGGLDDLQKVMLAIRETGALDYVRQQARREADIACAAISHLPPSNYKESLLQLSDFAVTRSF